MKLFGPNSLFITLVGCLLSIFSLVYGVLIGVWLVFYLYGQRMFGPHSNDFTSSILLQLLSILFPFGLPLLLLLICICFLWLCWKRGWDSSGGWRIVILVLLVVVLGVMSIDSPPIKDDYTTADVLIKGRDAEASYQTLMKYFGKDKSLKVVSPHEMAKAWYAVDTNLVAYSNIIEKAWNDSVEARRAMHQLGEYDVIVDITPAVSLGTNTPRVSFLALRNLAQTYRPYCLLRTENGESVEAARQLAEFHSAVMKLQRNSALLVTKMIFIALSRQDMETAYGILQHPKCAPEAVSILANAFPSVPGKDVSLRSPMICEYLGLKNICETFPSDKYVEMFRTYKESPGFIRRNVSRILCHLTFRRNTTVRMFKVWFDPLIAGASQSPMKVLDTEVFFEEHPIRPELTNPGGWCLALVALPSFARSADTASRTKVLSDLLAIELHKRSGDPIDIPDFYSGKPYFVDEKTGKLTSVGPDGIAGTKDDIQLGQSL
jgi:hypothetical protein